jgi:hypothetical protein
MLYKTIAMELISELPELQKSLQSTRQLRVAIEAWAGRLRNEHQRLVNSRGNPSADDTLPEVSSQALEIAISCIREELSQIRPSDR